jgi:hypothetical protein
MNVAIVIAIPVVFVLLVVGAYIAWRRRQQHKLDERRQLASLHRDMASMTHFEAEREAARESGRERALREQRAEQQHQTEGSEQSRAEDRGGDA